MTSKLKKIFSVADIRKRILFTLLVLAIFRLLAHLPLPGVNLGSLRELFSRNALLGILDLFSGGGLQNFSIATLGVNPYITSSIIFQLLTMVFPTLEALAKEGEYGRAKINQYTRLLTVPLSLLQGYATYLLLSRQDVIDSLPPFVLLVVILTMSAGTFTLLWLGELIGEYGIGNGISVIIFSGIVARVPLSFGQTVATLNTQDIFSILFLLVLGLVLVGAVVIVNEAQRRIPIQYARRIRGGKAYGGQATHLPLRLNQAGMIPIIFALSLIFIPGLLAQPLASIPNPTINRLVSGFLGFFSPGNPFYNLFYFLLVFGFTYFYTAVTFNPEKIAEDVKRHGGFVPGVRPGRATAQYLNWVATRVTLVGGVFLGVVAVAPSVLQSLTGVLTLTVGGAGILIVVSVVLETVRQVEAMMTTRDYEGFLI